MGTIRITIEGTPKSGKTTIANMLVNQLKQLGVVYVEVHDDDIYTPGSLSERMMNGVSKTKVIIKTISLRKKVIRDEEQFMIKDPVGGNYVHLEGEINNLDWVRNKSKATKYTLDEANELMEL